MLSKLLQAYLDVTCFTPSSIGGTAAGEVDPNISVGLGPRDSEKILNGKV
jgi:hypothetical protein